MVSRRGPTGTCGATCHKLLKADQQRQRYAADRDRYIAKRRAEYARPEVRAAEIEAQRRRNANGYGESHRAGWQRRRARTAGATVERFTPCEIFDRDRWRCGVCRKPVSSTVVWPDPASASLDHVVPLSKGGEHSRANTRLAHLRCNVSRGNRGEAEQLALLG